MDMANSTYNMSDREFRLYKIAVCIPLGCLVSGGIEKAKHIPSHFSRVRKTTSEDYESMKSLMGDLKVGVMRSGGHTLNVNVGIEGEALHHHIGVFATTGMGKSNLMKVLAGAVMESGRYGMLIFDPHGEYYSGGAGRRGLIHHPLAQDKLRVYSTRRLQRMYSTIRISYTEVNVEDMLSLYEFTQSQLEMLYAARALFGREWMREINERDGDDLYYQFGERFHETTINVVKRRVERVMGYEIISRDPTISITRSVLSSLHSAMVVLVDTSGLHEGEELLVSNVLARAVFEENRRIYREKPSEFRSLPSILITIEEAQRMLATPSGTIFPRIAREGRKFKVGLCAISQQPKLIHREILSQFNTLFILGLADKRDREALAYSAKQDISALENEIQTLMPGEAIITSPFTPFPLPIKVHMYEEYLSRIRRKRAVDEKQEFIDEKFF